MKQTSKPTQCLKCPKMWCKVFTVRNEKWTGWCRELRMKVDGSDPCHIRGMQQSLF